MRIHFRRGASRARCAAGVAWLLIVAGASASAPVASDGEAVPRTAPVELSSLEALALAREPSLVASRHTERALAADARAAGSLPPPTVGVDLWQVPLSKPYAVGDAGMLMLSARQEIPAPGSLSMSARAGFADARVQATHVAARYRCPMHPEITSDVPGECPICHMSLEPIPEEPPAAPSGGAPPNGHPHGGPVSPGKPSGTAAARAPEPPPGTSVITLTFDRAQAIGVRTALVETAASGEPLRVAASVEAPSLAAAEVHVRTPGFIESVALREIGAKVHAGQTLATVYSPEVYQAEQELLAVLEWKGGAGGPPPLEDAKRRLELLAVPRATIDRIVASRAPIRALAITSPIDGFVVRKSAVLGGYVGRETSLFDVVGLDRVYVVASVEPTTLSDLKIGASARFVTPSVPGRFYDATVDLVYPTIDPVTRQARVRFSLKNADLSLRPGQVGTAELAMTTSAALVVPLDAVVQTGRATYVFVAGPGGTYSARSVELGEERGDGVVVRGAIQAGDRVVSRATFLVDSDSRIRASLTRASGAGPEPGGTPAEPGGTPAQPGAMRAAP